MSGVAHAATGLTVIPATAVDGPVTLYYPTDAAAQPLERGLMTLTLAQQGAPVRGNGRLIVISHGSGGSPWVHADLARSLVQAGYVVALPEHHADNYRDDSDPGPDSWTLRPFEVSRAIDAVGRDPRFAPLLSLDKVGVYGVSAGGHTVLELAGGRWSPAGFARHCQANLGADFPACVGLITGLDGGPLDALKQWVARVVIRHRFGADDRVRSHTDPRVAVAVASVPFAADFDMASFAAPLVPLGLVTARHDRWLAPRFHGDRVLQACPRCVHIGDFPDGGHGALLSPLPPGFTGRAAGLLSDPPGFDRSQVPAMDRMIAAFFIEHLPSPGAASAAASAVALPPILLPPLKSFALRTTP
jgi:predicted dienelactone hydrolase